MHQTYADFHLLDDEAIYHVGDNQSDAIDLEQIDQFQPEVEPRSTTSALTDLYTSSQIESQRYRDQGDPNEYSTRFEDQ